MRWRVFVGKHMHSVVHCTSSMHAVWHTFNYGGSQHKSRKTLNLDSTTVGGLEVMKNESRGRRQQQNGFTLQTQIFSRRIDNRSTTWVPIDLLTWRKIVYVIASRRKTRCKADPARESNAQKIWAQTQMKVTLLLRVDKLSLAFQEVEELIS